MQRLEVSCAVRRIYTSLGAKGLMPYGRLFSKHEPTDVYLPTIITINTPYLGVSCRVLVQKV